MLQEYDTVYTPYSQSAPASVGILDEPFVNQAPPEQMEQDAYQPPQYPGVPPTAPSAPRKRPGRSGAILLLALALLLIFSVGLFAGWEFTHKTGTSTTSNSATTTTSSGTTAQTQQEAAIAKIEPSVVEIQVKTSQGEQIGSGVIIDSNGDIVTNNHVISGSQTITVVLNTGSTEQAQIVGTDAADDLAVVRIQPFAKMVVAQIANSASLTVGQDVIAVGNPLGITETATEGIVSALNRSVTESAGVTISNAIQTSAAINPGNSGGGLVNLQGQLIGIPTLTAVNTESNTIANGIGFAIPSNIVQTAIQKIIK